MNRVKLSKLVRFQNLHPPIRVHISKRDGKSFFLNWTPHPESSDETIDGYRIFIDDVLRITSEKSQTQAVIDCIREEGDYKLKVRSFNKNGESADSNVTIIRFRRQKSQSERSVQSGDDSISTSPNFGQSPANLEENILLSKPPSPPGAGLMSRLIKQSVKVKRNNVLLNGLPLNSTEIVNKPVASSSDFSGQNSNKSSNSFWCFFFFFFLRSTSDKISGKSKTRTIFFQPRNEFRDVAFSSWTFPIGLEIFG